MPVGFPKTFGVNSTETSMQAVWKSGKLQGLGEAHVKMLLVNS